MKNLRKNTDAQHLLDAHIPWYRTRKFWAIALSLQFILNIVIFTKIGFSLGSTFHVVIFAVGGGLIHGVSLFLWNSFQATPLIAALIYVPAIIIFILNITKSPKLQILYPLFISISMLVSLIFMIIATLYIGT